MPASAEDLLREALERGEGEQVEFKVRAVADTLARVIAAFANSKGGSIVVGVQDHGEVVGTDPRQVDAALRKALASLEPAPTVGVFQIERDAKSIVLLRVAPTRAGLILNDGRAYGRTGESISALSSEQIVHLTRDLPVHNRERSETNLASEIGRLAAAISRLTERNEAFAEREALAQGGDRSDLPERLIRILERFHVLALALSRRQRQRTPLKIADEYDVQDVLHAALTIDFEDVRAEEWTPSFAGAASRMDFLLKREETVVECKLTREGRADREIADELLIDIGRYQAHPDCKALVCFIYDPQGHIRNPTALRDDFSGRSTEAFRVRVVITPRAA